MCTEQSKKPYPAVLRKINKLNKRFWSKQSKLTAQRISDPILYALTMRDMHSEAIRVALADHSGAVPLSGCCCTCLDVRLSGRPGSFSSISHPSRSIPWTCAVCLAVRRGKCGSRALEHVSVREPAVVTTGASDSLRYCFVWIGGRNRPGKAHHHGGRGQYLC